MAERTHTYELTYIITPVISDEQTKDIVRRVGKYIDDNDGKVLETDEWGSKRLAYPINKKRNGYYVNLYFEGTGTLIGRLERALEIDDNILRYLTMRMDKKMLQHYESRRAKAAEPVQAPAEEPAEEPAEAPAAEAPAAEAPAAEAPAAEEPAAEAPAEAATEEAATEEAATEEAKAE